MALPESPAGLGLDGVTKERLHRFAAARQRSSNSVMREAVEQYLAREEKREQFWNDTVEAWDEYRQTGMHVPGAEMDQWFEKVEAGESCPPPECHL